MTVKDAFLTTTNANITEHETEITDLETEVQAARNSAVKSTNFGSVDLRLEDIEADMATLAAGSGTTVSANDAAVGTLFGTDGTDGKIRVAGQMTITEDNDGGDESVTYTVPVNVMAWF